MAHQRLPRCSHRQSTVFKRSFAKLRGRSRVPKPKRRGGCRD